MKDVTKLTLSICSPQQYMRIRKPQVPDMSQAGMSQMTQTNWKFVETLLKECKAKVVQIKRNKSHVLFDRTRNQANNYQIHFGIK